MNVEKVMKVTVVEFTTMITSLQIHYPTIVNNDVTLPYLCYTKWIAGDQRALLLIQASLSEEAMAETLDHTTSKAMWYVLADAYIHDSIKRMHTLRDYLHHLQKGTSTVA
nr:zinc finger, CCHC-type, Gag-polypeptide of LTR copia-type [Tanacetum cinerariifolium]